MDFFKDAFAAAKNEMGDFGFDEIAFRKHVEAAFERNECRDLEKLATNELYLTLGLNLKNDAAWRLFDRNYKVTLVKSAIKIVINSLDADCVQSICIEEFLRKGISYSGAGTFSSWLYSVAYKRAVDYVRKSRRHDHETLNGQEGGVEASPYSDCENIVSKIVTVAKDALAPEDLALIDLYFFQKMKKKEIAKVIGRNPSNVTRAMQRTCKNLGKLVTQTCSDMAIDILDVIECIRLMGIGNNVSSRSH